MNGKGWRKWSGYPEKTEDQFKLREIEPGQNVGSPLNSPVAAPVTK